MEGSTSFPLAPHWCRLWEARLLVSVLVSQSKQWVIYPPVLNLPWTNTLCNWKDGCRSSMTLTNNSYSQHLFTRGECHPAQCLPDLSSHKHHRPQSRSPTWPAKPRTVRVHRQFLSTLAYPRWRGGLPWAERTPSPDKSLDPMLWALDDISASPFIPAILNQEVLTHFRCRNFRCTMDYRTPSTILCIIGRS